MAIYKIIIAIMLIFNISFSKEKFDKIIEKETNTQAKKIDVKRNLKDRDIFLISKINATTIENISVANQIRQEMKNLILEKPNLMPILEEDMEGFSVSNFIINYEALKSRDISYLLNGNLSFKNDEFILVISIYDALKGEQVARSEFRFTLETKDLFIKKLTTQVYEFLTGEFGFFYGKLLYTVTNRPGVKPFKRVILSSRENNLIEATAFTNGLDITFNPRYCADASEVFFISQKPRKSSEIFVANRITGAITKLPMELGSEKSIFSPSISSDCSKVIISVAEEGSTNLYTYDRESNILKKITNTRNIINTAPEFFDNDKKIIFVSDRTGKPKIWEINIDGSNLKQITKDEGAYYSPSVSQDGKKVVFVNVKSGVFYLKIADINGTKEETLYSSFLIENPSWSPIGKTIIFSMKKDKNDKSRIYSISLNGREPEELDALSGNLGEPKWLDEF
jgi:TolB protein